MTTRPWTTLPAVFIALAALAPPASGQDPDPLFASNEVLAFRLETDLGAVFKERGQESKEYPAKLSHTAADGPPVATPAPGDS